MTDNLAELLAGLDGESPLAKKIRRMLENNTETDTPDTTTTPSTPGNTALNDNAGLASIIGGNLLPDSNL